MPDTVVETTNNTAPAPQSAPPSVTPSSGASGAGAVGQPAAPAAAPQASFKDQLSQAAGVGQTAAPTNMLGQPTGAAPEPQPQAQATFETILAQHPHLAGQFNSILQLAMYGQQHLGRPQQPAAPVQPQPAGPETNAFGIPKFDKSLLPYLFQIDPVTGEQKPNPYAPPQMLAAYRQYEDARRTAIEALLDDPEKALEKIIDKHLSNRGPQIADSRIADVQTRAYVQQFTESPENRWLWQTDAQGRPTLDWRGQKQLSETGRYFQQQVQNLIQSGVTDVRQQVQIASQLTYAALLAQQQNQSRAAQQAADQGKQNLLNSAETFNTQPPAGQGQNAMPQTFTPPTPGTNNTREVLRNGLRQAFAANGVDMNAPVV